MKNLYARLYAGLLSFLERHQPGVGGMKLPNRVIVSERIWAADGSWSLHKNGTLEIKPGARSPSEAPTDRSAEP